MAKYRIIVRKPVFKDLARLPKKDVQKTIRAIQALGDDPRPSQSRKLCGDEKYRLRCGVYRILYEIDEGQLIVCVVRVRHRRDV